MKKYLSIAFLFIVFVQNVQSASFLETCLSFFNESAKSPEQLIAENRYQEAIWGYFEQGKNMEGIDLNIDVRRKLEKGIVIKTERTEFGAHNDGRLFFDNGLSAIFKPNVFYKRDLFAYQLDVDLGLNQSPMTIEYRHNGKVGSLQLWVEGAKNGTSSLRRLRFFNSSFKERNFFQYLLGQGDYNNGNYLYTKNGRVVSIDNSIILSGNAASPEKNINKYIPRKEVFDKLKGLNFEIYREEIIEAVMPLLGNVSEGEQRFQAFIARASWLVKLIDAEVSKRGEQVFLDLETP